MPITARLLADMITVAGADRVLTIDLHAGQIQGFFNIPVDELTAVYLLAALFPRKRLRDPVVVSTDIGNAKRARNFAELTRRAAGDHREAPRWATTSAAEALNLIGSVDGRQAILVDDEIDTAARSPRPRPRACLRGERGLCLLRPRHPLRPGHRAPGEQPHPRDGLHRHRPDPAGKVARQVQGHQRRPAARRSDQRIHTGASVSGTYAVVGEPP